MEATVDAVGRIVLPKALRDLLGLEPGSTVDISQYGAGLTVIPHGRTAKLVEENGALVVAAGETVLTDEVMYRLIDAGRR
jgi:AbrB family looped-hinge helix DNA binding protein